MKSSYKKLYLDPRWQKKRLSILKRDNFSCTICADNQSTLHVHHIFYRSDSIGPWDCPDTDLITLCDSCHSDEHLHLHKSKEAVLDAITAAGFQTSDDIDYMAYLIREKFNIPHKRANCSPYEEVENG